MCMCESCDRSVMHCRRVQRHAAANMKDGVDKADVRRFAKLGRSGRTPQHIEDSFHRTVNAFSDSKLQVCETQFQ